MKFDGISELLRNKFTRSFILSAALLLLFYLLFMFSIVHSFKINAAKEVRREEVWRSKIVALRIKHYLSNSKNRLNHLIRMTTENGLSNENYIIDEFNRLKGSRSYNKIFVQLANNRIVEYKNGKFSYSTIKYAPKEGAQIIYKTELTKNKTIVKVPYSVIKKTVFLNGLRFFSIIYEEPLKQIAEKFLKNMSADSDMKGSAFMTDIYGKIVFTKGNGLHHKIIYDISDIGESFKRQLSKFVKKDKPFSILYKSDKTKERYIIGFYPIRIDGKLFYLALSAPENEIYERVGSTAKKLIPIGIIISLFGILLTTFFFIRFAKINRKLESSQKFISKLYERQQKKTVFLETISYKTVSAMESITYDSQNSLIKIDEIFDEISEFIDCRLYLFYKYKNRVRMIRANGKIFSCDSDRIISNSSFLKYNLTFYQLWRGLFIAIDSRYRDPLFLVQIVNILRLYGRASTAIRRNNSFMSRLIRMIVLSIDVRDSYTSGHSKRVAAYSKKIASALGYSAEKCDKIELAGLLHDLGKIAIPDIILMKPGSLSDYEYGIIKYHPVVAYKLLKILPEFADIALWIKYHHERVDGRGYPNKISSTIPVESKILAVADVFDALTSERTYRNRMSVEQAIKIIGSASGYQFDSKIVAKAISVLPNTWKEQLSDPKVSAFVEIECFRREMFGIDWETGLYGNTRLIKKIETLYKQNNTFSVAVLILFDYDLYRRDHSFNHALKSMSNMAKVVKAHSDIAARTGYTEISLVFINKSYTDLISAIDEIRHSSKLNFHYGIANSKEYKNANSLLLNAQQQAKLLCAKTLINWTENNKCSLQ